MIDVLIFVSAWVVVGVAEFAILRRVAGFRGKWNAMDVTLQAFLIIMGPFVAPVIVLMGIIYTIRGIIERSALAKIHTR